MITFRGDRWQTIQAGLSHFFKSPSYSASGNLAEANIDLLDYISYESLFTLMFGGTWFRVIKIFLDICSYAAGVLFLHTVIDYLWRMRKIHVRVEMAEDTTATRNVISNLNQWDKAFLEDENNRILLQKYLDSNPPYSQTLKDE